MSNLLLLGVGGPAAGYSFGDEEAATLVAFFTTPPDDTRKALSTGYLGVRIDGWEIDNLGDEELALPPVQHKKGH